METPNFGWLGRKTERLSSHDLSKRSISHIYESIRQIVTQHEDYPSTGASILAYMAENRTNMYLTGGRYFVNESELVDGSNVAILYEGMKNVVVLGRDKGIQKTGEILKSMIWNAHNGLSGVNPYLLKVRPTEMLESIFWTEAGDGAKEYNLKEIVPTPHITIGSCSCCVQDHRTAVLSALVTVTKGDSNGVTVANASTNQLKDRLQHWRDFQLSGEDLSKTAGSKLSKMLQNPSRATKHVLRDLQDTEILYALERDGAGTSLMKTIDWDAPSLLQCVLIKSTHHHKGGRRDVYNAQMICRDCLQAFASSDSRGPNNLFIARARNAIAGAKYLNPVIPARKGKKKKGEVDDVSAPRRTAEEYLKHITDMTSTLVNRVESSVGTDVRNVITASPKQRANIHFTSADKIALAKEALTYLNKDQIRKYIHQPKNRKGQASIKNGVPPSKVRKAVADARDRKKQQTASSITAMFGEVMSDDSEE